MLLRGHRVWGWTVWSSQCTQHCARHAAGLPPPGYPVSFPAAPALYLLGTLPLRQTAAFFCPWVWSHWLLLFSQSPRDSHCLLLRLLLAPCGEDSCVALGLAWCPLPLFTTVQCLTACHLPSAPSTSLRWGTARAPGTVLTLSWAWCPVENHYSHLDLPCPALGMGPETADIQQ